MTDQLSDAFDLIQVGMTYDGERVTEPGDLSDDLDELAGLILTLAKIKRVAEAVRFEVEGHLGGLLGRDGKHRYGDQVISWSLPWAWKTQSGAPRFVVDAVRRDPESVLDLFNVGSMRKTGVEKVAKRMGLDPEVVVETILRRERQPEPRIKWKFDPIGEQHDHTDDQP